MNKPSRGLRERRRREVMKLLARARPASLDPGPATTGAPGELTARLAAALGAHGTTGATRGEHGTPAQPGVAGLPRAPRQRASRRRGALLAGAGVTATAGAAAVAVLVATAGGPPTGSSRPTAQSVMLTAATVRHVASASRLAMARSGRAMISYRNSTDGVVQDTGSDDITFAGKSWNDVITQTFPASGGQRTHTQRAINRIVNGQFYLYIAGQTRLLQWYHDTNPSGHPSFTIPDPRSLFRLLEPAARFTVAGHQVVGGMRLRELRGTHLGHMPGLSAIPDVGTGGQVTALEVWVDSGGVIHRIALSYQQTHTVYHLKAAKGGDRVIMVPDKATQRKFKAALAKKGLAGKITVRVAPHGAGQRQVQVASVSVVFSGIGQPQKITVPRHAIDQYSQG